MGAFLELAEEAGADVVTPISASAPPSGLVHDAAYEYIADAICSSVSETQPDAIMLCLHGAMAVESTEDGEGELLRRIRAIAPDTPIAITLDMHCNFYDEIAKFADTSAGYHTYPHEDQYETAMRAGKPLLAMMAGSCAPVTSWGNRRMLPHIMRQSTLDPYPGREFKTPNKAIQERCLEMETSGDALIASVFVGFPHAVRSLPPSLPRSPSPLLLLLTPALSYRPPSDLPPPSSTNPSDVSSLAGHRERRAERGSRYGRRRGEGDRAAR